MICGCHDVTALQSDGKRYVQRLGCRAVVPRQPHKRHQKSRKTKKEDDQVILFIICSAFFFIILLVLQRESRQEPHWQALSLWRQELQPKEGWE